MRKTVWFLAAATDTHLSPFSASTILGACRERERGRERVRGRERKRERERGREGGREREREGERG